jgi:hypothetical protein
METTRVPTSATTASARGWSLETAIDYLLGIIGEKHTHTSRLIDEKDEHTRTLIAGNDKRYEQRFDASQKALEVGFAAAKAAVDASFAAQKEAINAALAAADRAVSKAELATEKRFESVNEFRGTLDNQQRTLIPRSEVDVMVKGVEEKIQNLTKLMDGVQAERLGIKGGWGYAVGVAGFVALVYGFVASSKTPAPVVAAPQVIYVPSPPGTMLPSTPPQAVPR